MTPYQAITAINGTLYFEANDGIHGAEPWVLPVSLSPLAQKGLSATGGGFASARPSQSPSISLPASLPQPIALPLTSEGFPRLEPGPWPDSRRVAMSLKLARREELPCPSAR